jgi:uncharacterized Ntn-hydrolase superfamily protein
VPFVASRVGAIATQGLVNPYYGIDGLRLLGEGHRPTDVLATLTRRDPGRAHRQAHMVGGWRSSHRSISPALERPHLR